MVSINSNFYPKQNYFYNNAVLPNNFNAFIPTFESTPASTDNFSRTIQPNQSQQISTQQHKKKSFWAKPEGIATIVGISTLATIATVALVKNRKINKTFENNVQKFYDDVFGDISSKFKKQGLELQKPKIEYIDEFTGEDLSYLAGYNNTSNIIKINKANYMQKTYLVKEKSKNAQMKIIFGDSALNKHMGKNKDKFIVSELSDIEKEICLKESLSHEIEHAAQYQAMLNYDKKAVLKHLANEKDIETLKGTWAYNFQPSKHGENFVFNYGNTFSTAMNMSEKHILGYDTKSLIKGLEIYPKYDKSTYLSEPVEIGARLRTLNYLEGKYGDLSQLLENAKKLVFYTVVDNIQKGMTNTQIKVQILKDGKPQYAPNGTSNRLTFSKN